MNTYRLTPMQFGSLIAVAVVIVIAAVAWLLRPVTLSDGDLLDLADSYIAASRAGDAESIRPLFEPDAEIVDNFSTVGLEEFLVREQLFAAWEQAQGTVFSTPECSIARTTDEDPSVTCEYTNHNSLAQAVDGPPVPFRLILQFSEAGRISRLVDSFGQPDFNTVTTWFDAWMAAVHPDDAEAAGCCAGETVQESVARGELLARYAGEYAAFLAENGCDYGTQCGNPAAAIESYVAAYNAKDLEGVMDLFVEESVIHGHPFTVQTAGLSAIESLQQDDMDAAAERDAYSVSDVRVSGYAVTWSHRWQRADGEEFCAEGLKATVVAGAILEWTWPETDFACEAAT